MALESLKSSKFGAFKQNELQDAFRIFGGANQGTTYQSGSERGSDCINFDTDDTGHSWYNGDGSYGGRCDYNRGVCDIVGPGFGDIRVGDEDYVNGAIFEG